MFIDKRLDRQGNVYYSFSYIDPITKKRIRLKKENHPLYRTAEEARAWADSQDAQRAARLELVARREAWKSTYYDFEQLFKRYSVHLVDKQPRSHTTYINYFENYAMEFFLGQKRASNPNNWYVLFPEFRDWLKGTTTRSDKPLATTTRNHVIVSVNNFLGFLAERGLMDPESNKKCQLFYVGDENIKGAECIVAEDEFADLRDKLKLVNEDVSDAFVVLYHTGMRFNELRGLNLSFLYPGEIADARVIKALKEAGKNTYHGYIHLMHQPAEKHLKRLKNFSIKRAPLKGCKTISHKNARIIPIFNKECWNILAARYLKQQLLFKEPKWGLDEENYLLFDGMAVSTFATTLKRTYQSTGYKEKTAHDLRHTYCTNLVGETNSTMLARIILGHKKESTQERYLHVYEQISQASQKAKKKIEILE